MHSRATEMADKNWNDHPFVLRLSRYIDLGATDIGHLRGLIENELTIKKRRDLVVDGYEYRKLCFIENGYAARYKLLRNGKRQIVNVMLPGDVVGLPGSFLELAAYSVIAITDLKIQVCSVDDYLKLCYQRPQFGLVLTWLQTEEAASYAEHLINIGRRSPVERLAHFLLEIHARKMTIGRATAEGFDLPFSQEVMGDALGLSIPHLNRMFSQLRAEGLIEGNARRVEFIDYKALQRFAHFQPMTLMRIPRFDQEALEPAE